MPDVRPELVLENTTVFGLESLEVKLTPHTRRQRSSAREAIRAFIDM